jgi:acetate kinase
MTSAAHGIPAAPVGRPYSSSRASLRKRPPLRLRRGPGGILIADRDSVNDTAISPTGESILVVNAGSSSIKLSLFEIDGANRVELCSRAQIDARDVAAAMEHAGSWLEKVLRGATPAAIGHRIVHGGPAYSSPVVVDDTVLGALETLVPLAPLHQPRSLLPIRALRERFPGVPQVACFDTAFHRTHSEVADRYALPESLYREGVRRYGFHGLSYESIARTLARVAPAVAEGAVIVAHLGSGASMCAMRGGRSVDSTMGFSALDGLPMGTRCGQLDPGVLLYLMSKGYGVEDLERLLYREAGLLGLSGISNDVRNLLESRAPAARLALDCFVYRCAREIASLAGALGGIDALVFTGGIGENSAEMRARICARCAWLGIRVDEGANRYRQPRISSADSRVEVWVVPTDEEQMIAEHTLEVCISGKERKSA